MPRPLIILVGVLIALVGAVTPVLLMSELAERSARAIEQDRLQRLAGMVLDRTESAMDDAIRALRKAATLAVEPCSAEHVAFLRRLTINTHTLDELGYFENGQLRCTSWGQTRQTINETGTDLTSRQGVRITVRSTPVLTGGAPMMILRFGDYSALIHPGRLADLVVEPGVDLALAARNGQVVSESGSPEPDVLRRILDGKGGELDGEFLYAVVHQGDWVAVALTHKEQVQGNLDEMRRWMLPLGAFIGLFLVGLVVFASRRRLSPLAELQTAVRRREFIVHYQPIIDLRSGRCLGAEALVRWRRPDGSLTRPDLFIPLAEDSGLILPITDQVLGSVMKELGPSLRDDPQLHVSINLCAEDIRSGRFLPVFESLLAEHGVAPAQLWLEVTERGFTEVDAARATLERARDTGYCIAMDDFGTGYSSLQYLHGLPVDVLKIDKSFVATIGHEAVASSVTGHIIDMARSLGLAIAAEGVEHAEQAEYLAGRGVEYGQGWFYARPMPAEEFLAFCAALDTAPAP